MNKLDVDKIKKVLSENGLKGAIAELDSIIDVNSLFYSDFLALKIRSNSLIEMNIKGIVSLSEYTLQSNQIAHSLLLFIDRLKNEPEKTQNNNNVEEARKWIANNSIRIGYQNVKEKILGNGNKQLFMDGEQISNILIDEKGKFKIKSAFYIRRIDWEQRVGIVEIRMEENVITKMSGFLSDVQNVEWNEYEEDDKKYYKITINAIEERDLFYEETATESKIFQEQYKSKDTVTLIQNAYDGAFKFDIEETEESNFNINCIVIKSDNHGLSRQLYFCLDYLLNFYKDKPLFH